jgi:hypothetical protein
VAVCSEKIDDSDRVGLQVPQLSDWMQGTCGSSGLAENPLASSSFFELFVTSSIEAYGRQVFAAINFFVLGMNQANIDLPVDVVPLLGLAKF